MAKPTGDGRSKVTGRVVLATGLISGTSALYQRYSEARAAERYPAPGTFADIGGRRLHVHDHGGDGPPIVIETGAGTLALSWNDLIPRLTMLGRVITYDRAGYGWSDAAGWRRDGSAVAADLHAALQALDIVEPIVLVGHSLGGLYARCFAQRYPDATTGLVLVDSSHEDMLDRVRDQFGALAVAAQAAVSLAMAAAPRGILRAGIESGALRRLARSLIGGDTDEDLELRTALYLRSAFRRASLTETLGIPATMKQLRSRGDLGDLPLAVVTAAEPDDRDHSFIARFRPAWLELQEDLASRSTVSWHLVAASGGHFVYQDDPDTVERAISLVVQSR